MLGAGRILVQRFGDILDGKRTWSDELSRSNVRPTLPDAVAGDITAAMPYRAMTNIIHFIEAVDLVVPGLSLIHIYGLLQPLTVRRNKDTGRYILISGERRLRALKYAEIREAPCIVLDTSDRQAAVFALIENIERQNLNYFEEAAAIRNLMTCLLYTSRCV